MESRKRPLAEEGDVTRAKKRAVSDEHDLPSHANGSAPHADEPKDGDNLELFRKEAIFRRMKYYSREHERSQARVAELELRRSTCEAGLAALEACWTQIIGTIRMLVKPEDLPAAHKQREEIRDVTEKVSSDAAPEYVEALREKMHTTSDLVKALVDLATREHSDPSRAETLQQCQESQAECSTLRAEVSLLRTRLRDAEAQKLKLHEDLVASEKRVDRLQSKSLAPRVAAPTVNGNGNGTESSAESSVQAEGSPAPNGTSSADADELRDLAALREHRLEELSHENVELRIEIQALKHQLKSLPEELVVETSFYKVLQDRASRAEHFMSEYQADIAKLRDENETLTLGRKQFEEALTAAHEQSLGDIKNLLAKRDTDNTRLREARDQYSAELTERKAKDSQKIASLNEFKTLAASRSERIAVLESEVTRLKTRLAAASGDGDLLSFLFRNQQEDVSYVDDLKRRLAAADEKCAALEQTIARLEDSRGDEVELRRQIAQLQKQLDKYHAVYGENSSLPPDVGELSVQLKHKQEELDKLHLQETQREQAETAMYSELDKLSSAWETLDRQVKGKVFDLAAMEERLTKLGIERAKSENKFYAAMRDKEAVENERKHVARNLEKQSAVVERLIESEKNLQNRIADMEKELALWKKVGDSQKRKTIELEGELVIARRNVESERKRADEMRAVGAEHERAIERRRLEIQKLEENVLRTKKEGERHAAKMKTLASATTSTSKEALLQGEVDKCMSLLKCSTCHQNMRNTVLLKCMHSFCKSCIDSRISTRQRKCPACNLAFGGADVQSLYFQ